MLIVRENTEGEYSSIGGRMYEGTEREIVMQQTVMSRVGVDRVLKFAFELAMQRPRRKLTSATKSNGISITMPYWDERVEEMAKAYPDVAVDRFHIDILTAHFVQRPAACSTWSSPATCSATSCPTWARPAPARSASRRRPTSTRRAHWPSLFEPVHGSAPDIAGRGVANPIGQIWSAALMLDFLGHRDAHDAIAAAIEAVLEPGCGAPRTPDLGGTAATSDLGRALARMVARESRRSSALVDGVVSTDCAPRGRRSDCA